MNSEKKNELNELSKTFKAISTKGLTKYLIDKFSILDGAKNSNPKILLGIFQNYLVFKNIFSGIWLCRKKDNKELKHCL